MDMREVLFTQISKISGAISTAINSDRTTIFVSNIEKNILECLYAEGINDKKLLTIPIGRGIAGYVANSKKSYLTNDVSKSSIFDPYYDKITGYRTKRIICCPILNELNECVGVIQTLNKNDELFTSQDVKILEGFASTAGILIQNYNMYAITSQMKNGVDTLLNVSSIINSELELEKVIELIINKSSEITNSDRSTFFLFDHINDELTTYFGQGLNNIKIKTNKGIVGEIAKTKKPIIENNPYQNPYFDQTVDQSTKYLTKSILGVPVLDTNNELIGVIEVINKRDGNFTEQDLLILKGFASHIAIAIQNAKLFGEVYSMKNYFNLLFENLDNGIITFDKDGYVKTINSKFCNLFDIQKDTYLNRHFVDLEADFKHIYQNTKRIFESGIRQKLTGLEVLKSDDKKSIYNLSSLPMNNIEGGNIGAINVIQDITTETRVQQNLRRYLPNHLVNEIFNKDDLSLLDGKYRRCSILFSDLRNFTTITEKMGAIEVVKFLNGYFSTMVDSVIKNNGILDKFIGDAIMAVFGIPYPDIDDVKNSVLCALNMLEKLKEFNKSNSKGVTLDVGIGIATGNVISGNVGSSKRFEYTVIGDSVNLASRLEGLSKLYNLNIIICSSTYNKISEDFHCREIDTVFVKGKNMSTKIYNVIESKSKTLSDSVLEFNQRYSSGLQYLKQKDFQRANEYFLKANYIDPNDQATVIQLKKLADKL